MAKFFDRMKKTLQEGLEVVKRGTEIVAEKTPEVAATVAERTQEAISIGKLKLQIQTLNHKVDKIFTEVGQKVYDLSKKKVAQIENDETVKKMIAEVNRLKKQLKDMEKKIDAAKKEKPVETKAKPKPKAKKTAPPSEAEKEKAPPESTE